MSDKQLGQAPQRKPSSNKNIMKLRTISMVCSLTSSWQQWVTENETKQATEPSGWGPSSLGGGTTTTTTGEPKKTRVPEKPPPTRAKPADSSKTRVVAQTSISGAASETAEVEASEEPPAASRIKTKQVVKTVISGVHEKSAGIGLLTEKIQNDSLPSAEEMEKRKSSPTRRRKCSNIVSSLTDSRKRVEKEQKPIKDGDAPGQGQTCGVDKEERGISEEGKERPDVVADAQTRSVSKEAETDESEGDTETAVRIKRPSAPPYKKEADHVNSMNALSRKYSAVGNLKSRWQNWASEHTVNQKLNPFSEYFDHDYSMSLRLQKGQDGYGRPKEGTKTAERAKRAEQHIHREIGDMCFVIRTMADPDADGKTRVTFAELFDRYVRISDKVVGILMRARKHGKVAFEGEMLWQGQDDGVIITLLV
ncbi:actin binding Rho activating protein b [Embiotoca jacksoni]|uniref:actin binding Rho activating protein b n=1 Tax=Embiotoca jacksoni TaxID=100190 RepID=UPI003703EA06